MVKNIYSICLLIVNILTILYIASIVMQFQYFLFFVLIALLLLVASIIRIHRDAKVNRFQAKLSEANNELKSLLERYDIDND